MASLHTQRAVLEFVLELTGGGGQKLARASVYPVCVIAEGLIVLVSLAFARRVSMGRFMGSHVASSRTLC
jgi:hypothetical protein